MSSTSRGSHRQNDPAPPPSNPGPSPRMRPPDRMPPPDIDDSSTTYHQRRSHVSRSPDIAYFQNASRSGSSDTNAIFQGTVTYQSQQEVLKEPSRHYTETSLHSSEHAANSKVQSASTYSHIHSGNDDNVSIERSYPPEYGGKVISLGRQHSTRSRQNKEDNRSHDRSTSGTPPTLDNRDTLKQPVYVDYQRPVLRQDERPREGKRPTYEQERHENYKVIDVSLFM